MKPDTFDFKSLTTFPANIIPNPLSSHAFKNSENSLCLEEVRECEIKPNKISHI